MNGNQHNKIVSFIWGIADDVLRDLFKRGKYPDIILPMCVLRRFDAVLEPTKQKVLDEKKRLDKLKIPHDKQHAALCDASKQAFYNLSKFCLKDMRSRTSQQQLEADFTDYLDGYSSNVQEIFTNFDFRNKIHKLCSQDALGMLIDKFLDTGINLSPFPVKSVNGDIVHEGLDNHAMGTIFEELVRKFNEENNEEAGEHWTPRDAVKLMADLIFIPIADKIKSGSYLLYDGACGTGGMLTIAEERLKELTEGQKKKIKTYLFGQEINPETYAICKADMLLKGEGDNADHIVGGEDFSTLSKDAFTAREFDFMLSNPPYGKSWKKDLEKLGGKENIRDTRFKATINGEEYSLLTRSSDGQMLFLANMISKMNNKSELGSRIAEVHNGSSLFTGDAGQGESNIRRWIFENDWLEAIVALPLNMFYNTGIATYIWVLTNNKPEHRKGKVQLIDATEWYKPLRKNLGKKNCELSEEDIKKICDTYLDFKETEQSKIFDNKAFGYWKVTVDRPLRLYSQFTNKAIENLRFNSGDEDLRSQMYDEFGEDLIERFGTIRKKVEKWLNDWGGNEEEDGADEEEGKKKGISDKKKKKLFDADSWKSDAALVDLAFELKKKMGEEIYKDHNEFRRKLDEEIEKIKSKVSMQEIKAIINAISWREELAQPVIAKIHKPGKTKADPMHGLFEAVIDGEKAIVEYESDSELRDTEQIPLLEKGGIEAFIKREVLPYTPDAWIDEEGAKIGYEISFTRHFYKPQPLRSLEEIQADILKVQKESEGLLDDLIGGKK